VGASHEPAVRKAPCAPPEQSPGARSDVPRLWHALQMLKDAQNEHVLLPSLPGRKFSQICFLSLLSETKDQRAVKMLQLQMAATGVLGTKELAPPPVMSLGTRGVWEDRLSVREQRCNIFQKGKTVSKSSDSLLSLPALKNIYSMQTSAHGAWICQEKSQNLETGHQKPSLGTEIPHVAHQMQYKSQAE